jgi:hypothetical protein
MNSYLRLRLSRAHRLLGLIALVPLAGWIVSSFVLHGVGLTLPNGLQGVYELEAYHPEDVSLEGDDILSPSTILDSLASGGLARIYWLRLEPLASRPVYVVKPGPFELERVYDARSGERLDPLRDDLLQRIGDGALTGTSAGSLYVGDEFNRYYALESVPAVALEMEGDQPSELLLSRASGRTLRRTDPLASVFHKAYLSVHVWQWGDALRFFTTVLFALVGLTLVVVGFGFVLWFDRREARRRWTDQVRPARRLHARFAVVSGAILASQMLVGSYLWFNLGLIEPRFRGQGSFDSDWSGGIAVEEELADARTMAALLPADAVRGSRPIQRYEWRAIGEKRIWLAYPRRDANPVLIDAEAGVPVDRLSADLARQAGEMVVLGSAVGPPEESTGYWMDFNARVPTYLFRFSDPDDTDVHVSQITGEVVQRRPAIWRAFGPFLAYHTFGFTGNPWFDTLLLSLLQAVLLVMMVSGWRLAWAGRDSIMEISE